MDLDINQRLNILEKKIEENTILVQKIHKRQNRERLMKYVYWGIMILMSIVSLIIIKPYISQLGEAYGLGDEDGKFNDDYSQLLNSLD